MTQGLHVGLGLVLVPVVLAKLWSVIPRLFVWPPAKSVAHAMERATLLMLVGGILFEMVTGLMNIQYDYAFGFSFYTAHYIGAWVFIAGFVAHVALKLPTRTGVAHAVVAGRAAGAGRRDRARAARRRAGRHRPGTAHDEPPRRAGAGRRGRAVRRDDHGGADDRWPAARPRGAAAAGGAGGGPDFPINRTAAAAAIDPAATGERGG